MQIDARHWCDRCHDEIRPIAAMEGNGSGYLSLLLCLQCGADLQRWVAAGPAPSTERAPASPQDQEAKS